MTLAQVLSLPRWEIEAWRALFDVYGPLDWKRDDLLTASILRQNSVEKLPLRDFILFNDPSIKIDPEKERAARAANLLSAFGGGKSNNGEG